MMNWSLVIWCGLGMSTLVQPAPSERTVDTVLVSPLRQADVPGLELGVLSETLVKEGDTVLQGQPLARQNDEQIALDVEQAQIALRQAQAEAEDATKIAQAENALQLARADLKRVLQSQQRFADSVTESEIERKQLIVEQAELQLQQAQKEQQKARIAVQGFETRLRAAELKQRRHEIRAPFDGVVLQMFPQPGEWIEPGDPVLRLVQLDVLKAEGLVPADWAHALLHCVVQVDVPHGDKVHIVTGEVVFVSSEQSVDNMVKIRAVLDNRQRWLRPGMQLTMNILANKVASATKASRAGNE